MCTLPIEKKVQGYVFRITELQPKEDMEEVGSRNGRYTGCDLLLKRVTADNDPWCKVYIGPRGGFFYKNQSGNGTDLGVRQAAWETFYREEFLSRRESGGGATNAGSLPGVKKEEGGDNEKAEVTVKQEGGLASTSDAATASGKGYPFRVSPGSEEKKSVDFGSRKGKYTGGELKLQSGDWCKVYIGPRGGFFYETKNGSASTLGDRKAAWEEFYKRHLQTASSS